MWKKRLLIISILGNILSLFLIGILVHCLLIMIRVICWLRITYIRCNIGKCPNKRFVIGIWYIAFLVRIAILTSHITTRINIEKSATSQTNTSTDTPSRAFIGILNIYSIFARCKADITNTTTFDP